MKKKNEMRMLDRVALLSAVILVLVGGVLGIVSFGYIIDYFVPGFMNGRSNVVFLIPFLVGLFFSLVIGMFLGAVAWMLCMKPFWERSEIFPFVNKPHFPVITPALTWTFDLLYPMTFTEDK